MSASPSCLLGGRVEGRGCVVRGVPCLRIAAFVLSCPPPFTLSSLSSCVVPVHSSVCVASCLLWVGKCGGVCCSALLLLCCATLCCVLWWRVCYLIVNGCVPLLLSSSPLPLCVLCHGIVGLGLCFCGRVVFLWNSGDGLCVGRNGGGVMGVRGLVVCFVFLFSLSSSSLCVGVRGSARAALRARTLSPNTIVSSLVVFSLLFSAPRFCSLSAFLLLEWRWVIHHVSVCCVGMTATGSLSLSPSFFW